MIAKVHGYRLLCCCAALALLATTSGCGSDGATPDGGGPDAEVIGEPIEGAGTINASWPSGDMVKVSVLHMEARVPCATAGPDDREGQICDAVVTATSGTDQVFSLSFPSVASASGRTLSLNDPTLVRVEIVRADGMSATNTPGTPTVGTLVVNRLTISPQLALEAEFSADSHLTGGSAATGLVDVTLSGTMSLR